MVKKFNPEYNQTLFINQYSMFHILEGSGEIQVDFKNYYDWSDKLIFLEKGQYIKFLSEDFVVRRVDFEAEEIFKKQEVRALFKHLVSLGYINFSECSDCQNYLNDTVLVKPKNIIDISSKHWYWQNPFGADIEEYHVIFDIKEVIDNQYKNHLTSQGLIRLLDEREIKMHSLIDRKVGLSINNLFSRKRWIELQKEVAFTDKSIKEIAYDFGYKDPAYFNRTFVQKTGFTPNRFRHQINYDTADGFIQDLYELLHEFHTSQRKVSFYAEKMSLTEKTFSRKVKHKLQVSVGQLIRKQLISTARIMLAKGTSVIETSFELGFEEPNHFSSFFKLHSGKTPTDFLKEK